MSGYSPEDRARAAEQAAQYLMMLQDGYVSESDRAALVDWMRESPMHVAELLHASQLHRRLSHFTGWDVFDASEAGIGSVIRFPLHPMRRRGAVSRRRLWLPFPGSLKRLAVVTAVCLLAGGIAASFVMDRFGERVISTEWGERREVTLADGSIVDLAPSARVEIRLQPRRRLIQLERGEALFLVAKEPNRPFIVTAWNTRVIAVGTVFDVQRRANGVAVTVVEGRVSVAQIEPTRIGISRRAVLRLQQPRPLSLGADEQVIVPAVNSLPPPVVRVQSEAQTAWVTEQLNFDNESVAQVVRRFNQYNRVQIRVLDADLANRRISGSFRINDPQSFAAFLRSVSGLSETHPAADLIILSTSAKQQ